MGIAYHVYMFIWCILLDTNRTQTTRFLGMALNKHFPALPSLPADACITAIGKALDVKYWPRHGPWGSSPFNSTPLTAVRPLGLPVGAVARPRPRFPHKPLGWQGGRRVHLRVFIVIF